MALTLTMVCSDVFCSPCQVYHEHPSRFSALCNNAQILAQSFKGKYCEPLQSQGGLHTSGQRSSLKKFLLFKLSSIRPPSGLLTGGGHCFLTYLLAPANSCRRNIRRCKGNQKVFASNHTASEGQKLPFSSIKYYHADKNRAELINVQRRESQIARHAAL